MKEPILVVDDDDALRNTLKEALEPLDVEIETAESGAEAVELIGKRAFAVVVTDLVMKGTDGFAVLRAAKDRHGPTRVVILTAHGNREIAVQAMQEGATYYIEKPLDLAELRTKVTKCLEQHRKELEYEDLRHRVGREFGVQGILGQDPQMVRLLGTIRQIAPTQASILILGESGTGKELVARAVHGLSPRSSKPFVALNCGGLAEGTLESELFGHVRGAFTGAIADREGTLEYADGGTLFLDEVGEMPMTTQIKFLRVLEDQEVSRLGSNKSRTVDVRVIAATNADVQKKVTEGTFREDLYYRLKVVTLEMPPLRERRGDIKILVDYFLRQMTEAHGKDVESVDRDALAALVAYEWPGNVRELRNVVESMVVRARGNILTIADLPPEIGAPPLGDSDSWHFLAGKSVADVEKNHIRVTLELTRGNRVKAAATMGISERTLYRKIREYEL